MSWSGHSKYETFKKYIKLSDAYKKTQSQKLDDYYLNIQQMIEFNQLMDSGDWNWILMNKR